MPTHFEAFSPAQTEGFIRFSLFDDVVVYARGTEQRECARCGRTMIRGLGPGVNLTPVALQCGCGQWNVEPLGSAYVDKRREDSRFVPFPLYRYFETEQQKFDFLEGNIWISTLSHCRNTEDAKRGDDLENAHRFRLTRPIDFSGRPRAQVLQSRFGIHVDTEKTRDITVTNTERVSISRQDYYVLCLSSALSSRLALNFSKDGGKHAVILRRPTEFFDRVSATIAQERVLAEGRIDKVVYDKTDILDDQPDTSGDDAFRKPPRFLDEAEVRMLWGHKGLVPLCRGLRMVGSISRIAASMDVP